MTRSSPPRPLQPPRPVPAPWLAVTLALALLTGAAPAAAHDTWFQPLAPSSASASAAPALALGTGNRIPRHETAIGMEFLARQGCSDTRGRVLPDPMTLLRYELHATVLHAPVGARTCWAQLVPLNLALAPDMVAVYLDEIQAPDAVRQAWAAQQRRGVVWQERYTKHARIDLGAQAPPWPTPMAMDVLRQTAPDGGHRFTLLRDGRPLPGLPVELRHDASPIGLWRRTDAQGRVDLPALPAGRWVLRGTELRPSEDRPDTWDSGFLTLAFEVQPAPPAPAGPGSAAER